MIPARRARWRGRGADHQQAVASRPRPATSVERCKRRSNRRPSACTTTGFRVLRVASAASPSAGVSAVRARYRARRWRWRRGVRPEWAGSVTGIAPPALSGWPSTRVDRPRSFAASRWAQPQAALVHRGATCAVPPSGYTAGLTARNRATDTGVKRRRSTPHSPAAPTTASGCRCPAPWPNCKHWGVSLPVRDTSRDTEPSSGTMTTLRRWRSLAGSRCSEGR
ncbi:hypothetical protein ACCUM_0054 [Candidatus Accumulibacter phosphatis]|uniref:Uncharacterized protein n=1 Tax=Candidatus Accumulibacter phosphatis TaxID=327160 RepID=A0A5S4EGW9_9PROT|nr:hypothetical protein ACCUM_0054 [Candidatus Accumulibacter phosphatis]